MTEQMNLRVSTATRQRLNALAILLDMSRADTLDVLTRLAWDTAVDLIATQQQQKQKHD